MVNPILIAVRRPCLLRRTCYYGFFRCSAVRAALAPPETRPGGAFGCARSSPFASAKQRAFGSVHYPAASAPLAPLMRARGLRPEKPSAFRGAAKATLTWTSVGSLPILVLVWVACASPRKAEGFFGLPARTHQLCEGCGGGGCEKRCPKARFSGLAKEAQRSRRRVGPTKVRARRPTPEHRKNP